MIRKIKNKKAQNTLTGLFVSSVIALVIFFAAWEYISYNASQAEVTLDSKYTRSYENMTSVSDSLTKNINDLKDNYDGIKEAASVYQVAVNGLKGLGNTLKLPISFSNTIIEGANSLLFYDIIPGWLISLISMTLLGFVIILMLRLMKGEQAM